MEITLRFLIWETYIHLIVGINNTRHINLAKEKNTETDKYNSI